MKSLSELLQRSQGRDFGELPPGACETCLEFHECFTCHDGGRVRYEVPLGHQDFGKSHLCPACNGYVDGVQEPTIEAQEERLRIPQVFRGVTMEMLSEGQTKAIRGVVTQYPTHPMVTLSGTVGSGKTTAAVAALKESLRLTGKAGRFWPVVDLLERFRSSYDPDRAVESTAEIEAEMRSVHLLVLDDFGKQKSTQWAEEKLFKLVDERYRERKPLIVTTNIPRGDFEPPLHSRLFGTHAKVVEFQGADRRMA